MRPNDLGTRRIGIIGTYTPNALTVKLRKIDFEHPFGRCIYYECIFFE